MLRVKNILKMVFAIVFLVFASSLLRDAVTFSSFQKSLGEAEKELAKLEEKNKELELEKRYLTSQGYKEIQIRDKLGLAKENEIVVVLPGEETLRKLSPRKKDDLVEEVPKANWELWSEVFFKNLAI